jgi:hypothetical protein
MKDIKSLRQKLSNVIGSISRYRVFLFFLLLAAVYGFLLYRINTLNSAEPASGDISSTLKTVKLPHIDQTVVQQLQSLQDNSVSVQTLFSEARNNPFQ